MTPTVGLDFIQLRSFVKISRSESWVYSQGNILLPDKLSSSRLIMALPFLSSSSRYPSLTNPSVVISKSLGFSLSDCDCSIGFTMMLSFISWTSSIIAKSMLRPSLFLVVLESFQILVFVFLFKIKRWLRLVSKSLGSNMLRIVSIAS